MELTARSVGEPNDGGVLRAAMAVTAFVPGGDVPGDVDDEVALTLPSQRPMIFQDSEVEMRDRAGMLETAVDIAVDHGSPPECAKMLRDIVFRTHLDELFYLFFKFFFCTSTFQLLDKPWSQGSSLLPPVLAFNFYRA